MKESVDHHPLVGVVSAAVTAGTMAVAFGLLALGVEWFWVAFPVGFGGVLPVSLGILHYAEERRNRSPGSGARADSESALAELRERYARGDLTEAEFERRLERLLETESRANTHRSLGDSPPAQTPDSGLTND
jgi:uncharacterized membrane protein